MIQQRILERLDQQLTDMKAQYQQEHKLLLPYREQTATSTTPARR